MASLAQLETEFALLIKALSVLQKMQSSPGTSNLVINFFDSLRNLMDSLPRLSLSAYWKNTGERCLVGIPINSSADEVKSSVRKTSDDEHDPIKIVQFLGDKAKNTLVGTLRDLFICNVVCITMILTTLLLRRKSIERGRSLRGDIFSLSHGYQVSTRIDSVGCCRTNHLRPV